jgi:hypothetical protein
MKNILNEELIKQIRLMNFDRSKTLFEQKPDELMPGQIETMGYVQGKPETLEPALKKQEQFFKDLFENKHEILMVSSLALTIFGGPIGNALAIGLDLGDAALYIAEGDPYMAGLSLLFVALPAGQLAAKYTKVEIKSTINSLKEANALIKRGKTPRKILTNRQKEIAKLITSTKVRSVAAINLFKTVIIYLIKTLKLRGVVKLIFWLFKKGYLLGKFLIKEGLIIGGVLYSWSKIAELMGIIEKTETIKLIKEKSTFTDLSLSSLEDSLNDGMVFSTKLSSDFLPEVVFLQSALFSGNYRPQLTTYSINNGILEIKNAKTIKEYSLYTSTGKLVDSIKNTNKETTLKSKKLKDKGVYILKVSTINNTIKTIKINIIDNGQGNIILPTEKINDKPKWGYYDNFTEDIVKEYQKKNGLVDDGICGPKTIESIINNIKNGTIKNIKNISNYTIKDSDIDKLSYGSNEKIPTKEEMEDAKKQQIEKITSKIIDNNDTKNRLDQVGHNTIHNDTDSLNRILDMNDYE